MSQAPTPSQIVAQRDNLLAASSESLLQGLDAVGTEYERQSELVGTILYRVEAFILITTFFTLLLEIKYIFRPMEREINLVQQELRAREERLNYFIKYTPAAVALFDCDMRYLACSDRWIDDYGLKGVNVIGRSHYEVFPEIPLYYPHWMEDHHRCLDGEIICVEEDTFIRSDGKTEWVRYELRPWYNVQGGIAGMTMFTEVITKERRLKQENDAYRGQLEALVEQRTDELELQKNLMSQILENLPVALFAKSVKQGYRWMLWNKKAEEIFERKASDILGKNDYEMFPEQEADQFRQTDEMVMSGRVVVNIPEEEVTTKRGTWLAHTRKVPIYDEDGNPDTLVAILEDITLRKQNEDMLKQAKEQAESATIAKSDFLANMSHELRTPLNSIMGMLYLMKDDTTTPQQKELIDTAMHSSSLLLELVNDILDISKIEANEVTLEHIGFDAVSLVNRNIASLKPLAAQKGLALTLEGEVEAFPYLMGDPARLSSVLTNLISNAIKYTAAGSVKVKLAYMPNDVHCGTLHCSVTDTGIGIAADKIEVIFNKFSQADNSTTRRFGGTGLGLAITKQLLELMKGDIHVSSIVGKGSTFHVAIPYETTDTLHKDASPRKRAHDKQICGIIPANQVRVLVAEDHPLNKLFIAKLFARYGIENYDIYPDGMQVWQAYQEQIYDIIMMDCHMPEMNGYEVTEIIRHTERFTGKHTPIIAMTANAMHGDREACLAAGMDEYISKPVDPKEFKALLSQWVAFPAVVKKPSAKKRKHPANVIDLTMLRSFSDGDIAIEQELVAAFVEASDKNIALLRSHCTEGACEPWVEAAHMLKGGAGSMGASILQGLCADAQLKNPARAKTREALFQGIEQAYSQVLQVLQEEGIWRKGGDGNFNSLIKNIT